MNSDEIVHQSRKSFRSDVEGLRAVAVLLVVACHCGVSWCTGGFVGVDVFFVISGYLITALLATEYRVTARIDLLGFYARRARRLLPALALVLLVTLSVAAVVFTPLELNSTGSTGRAAAFFMSNVFFDLSASDYFALNAQRNPLLHTWSLGVEEQFYLLWPLLILVIYRGPHRSRRLAWALGTITILSFLCSFNATRLAPTFAFYELPARAWEFAAGGLLALLPASRKSGDGGRAMACGIVGILMILGMGVFLKGSAAFPGSIALIPVAGTLTVLFAGARAPQRGVSAMLSAAPLQFIGARSYSWYLWHWPFVVFAGILHPGISIAGKVAAALASLLAAAVTFTFVEQPIRKHPYLIARTGLSFCIAAAATLVTIGASWQLIRYGGELALDQDLQSISAAATGIADISQKDCLSLGSSTDARTCVFGAPSASRTIVLFGDSHAMQWFNPVRTAALTENWRLVTVLKTGCPASYIHPHPSSTGTDPCDEWRSHAIDSIIAIHPSAIIMATYSGATLRGFGTEAPISTEELRSGTRWTLERLLPAGVPIVVIRDTPLPPSDISSCVIRHLLRRPHTAGTCDFDASVALNPAAFSAEHAAAENLRHVYFLDMSDLFCPASACPAILHGVLVYQDDNHLTGKFAETLAPTVRVRLFQHLLNAQ